MLGCASFGTEPAAGGLRRRIRNATEHWIAGLGLGPSIDGRFIFGESVDMSGLLGRWRVSRAVAARCAMLAVAIGLPLNVAGFESARAAASPSQTVEIDLSKPFGTRSPWQFVVTQDAATWALLIRR